MSLIYRRSPNQPSLMHVVNDYWGEIKPFAKRVDRKWAIVPLVLLKSIEWSIYRWYKTPIRRFYGVKGNELIYMITSKCNDRCAKCGIWKKPEADSDHLELNRFLDCLNRLHENLYQVTLTGGEPLMYSEDVLAIAREAHRLSVPMILVTNGALLTESFLKEYKLLGHELVISLDTLRREKWQEFRGRNHFDLVMGNIQLACQILGTKLRIQSVLAEETKMDMQEISQFCQSLGIEHVVQPYMNFGGTWNKVQGAANMAFSCNARKNICIYPNGDVVKCFDHWRIPNGKAPLGNVNSEDIIEILCKKRATEISRYMKTCNHPCKQLSCNKPA